MNGQKFCLKWDQFRASVTSVFNSLRRDQELVDMTLCCEGQTVKAHRMMLSACSPYFRQLLKDNPCQHPVFFLKDTSAADLRAVVEFVYQGEVNVAQTQLASFIKTAEMLQIRGLSGDEDKASPPLPPPPPACRPREAPPPAKRPRPADPDRAEVAEAAPGVRPGRAATPADTASDLSAASPLTSPETAAADNTDGVRTSRTDVKVEEIDLKAEEEEDAVSVDTPLGFAADFERHYGGAGPELRDTAGLGCHTGDTSMALAAGPSSQRLRDDATQPAKRHVCTVCGRRYQHRVSLSHHVKKHQGLTTCRLCGKVLGIMAHLRVHLETVHGLSRQAVRTMVPTRQYSGYSSLLTPGDHLTASQGPPDPSCDGTVSGPITYDL